MGKFAALELGMKMPRTGKRGGPRPGAGAPPRYESGRMEMFRGYMPAELIAKAERLGGGKVSAGVRLALENYVEPEPITRRVELWRHTATGDRYAVQVDGGIVIGASGPLNERGADAVLAGFVPEWDAELADWIADEGEHVAAFYRLWPEG
jgi:hypothetical protein